MDDDIEDEQRLKLEDEAVNSFTSARSIDELEYEISELRELVSLARQVEQSQTETKLEELRKVLEESKIFQNENEKLLIFTEHRDTLEYLFEKLQSWGLRVTQIHGLMRMDERIRAQEEFYKTHQVLIATEAAGTITNQSIWMFPSYSFCVFK